MEKLSLEEQYKLFLQRVKLSEATMHPQQKIQLKQAFYGACGQLLILFRDDVSKIENDKEAIAAMEDMVAQVGQFWVDQINYN